MRALRRLAVPTLAALLVSGAARADDGPNAALAETLFDEGQKLVAAGRIHEGCAKLAESQRLDPQLGTLLNLATCHEKDGKTATAWSEYKTLIDLAVQRGDSARVKYARDRAAALEKVLARIVLELPEDAQEVRIDDVAVGRAAWTTPLPVDAGAHEVRVSAPGKKTRVERIEVAPGAATTRVRIGPLEPEPVETPRKTEPRRSAEGGRRYEPPAEKPAPETRAAPRAATEAPASTRTLGFVIGGVGLAGLGVGAVFGLVAIGQKADVDAHCDASHLCDSIGMDAQDKAHTSALVSNIGFGVGIVGVAVGAFLILRSQPSRAALRFTPVFGSANGAALSGHF